MSRPGALRRATSAAIVIAAAALLAGNGVVGGTWAVFTGQTKNAGSVFANGWLDPAAAGTVTASGWNTSLAWTPGTTGLTGQELWGVNNGTSSTCTGATYSSLTTLASAATSSYTDTGRGTSPTNGNWFCYRLVSTRSGSSWTATYDFPAVQLGLATTDVTLTDVGTALRFEKNDTITLTFNQRIVNTGLPASGSLRVCLFGASDTILIGDTTSNCNNVTDTAAIGKLVANAGTSWSRTTMNLSSSTYTISTTAPYQMVITLAGTNQNSNMTGWTSWTYTPSGTPQSFADATTTVCTAANATCVPTVNGNF